MELTWQSKWEQIEDQETSKNILKKLADADYVPLTSTMLGVNELRMGGPRQKDYAAARDELSELGFIVYAWSEPVQLSASFKEYVSLQGDEWFDVLIGKKKGKVAPVVPERPPVPPPSEVLKYPAEVEDENFWKRFDLLVNPLLVDRYATSGEVLLIETARQGRRSTGGSYSRPDLTYVIVGRYPLLGERFVRIVSVEAKIWETADIVANAYEAVAYKRFSTQVYYAYESPDSVKRVSSEVEEILKENGVGIVRIWREGNKDGMHIDVDPVATDPAPDRLETYLGILRQIDEKGIVKLLHSKYR
jgi:hypothetical protein